MNAPAPIACREYPLAQYYTEADLDVDGVFEGAEAPAKTWADHVAEVTAACADVPERFSPFRPCRADLIRTILQQDCACDPKLHQLRDAAFAARLAVQS